MDLDKWGDPFVILKPYPNEHACRLQNPAKYDTCKRSSRVAKNPDSVKGKKYYVIFCKKKGESMEEQAYRYPKDTWTESQARAHCKYHGGKFEPAKKEGAMNDLERKYCETSFEAKAEGDERIIEGYASTRDIDRMNDIILPTAFEDTMPQYMKNPVMHFGHNWTSYPIGKIIGYEINRKGLYIKAKLSSLADDVWTLIKEGILKAMSIGFKIIDSEEFEEKDDAGNIKRRLRKIKKIDLYEISVVNVPANPRALIDSAKSIGLEMKSLIDGIEGDTAKKEYKTMGEPKEKVSKNDEVEKKLEGFEKKLDEITEKISKVDVNENIFGIIKQLQEADRRSNTELMEMISKSQEDFFKKYYEIIETQRKKDVSADKFRFDVPAIGGLSDIKVRDPYEFHAKIMADEGRALSDSDQRRLKELQRLNDDLYSAMFLIKMGICPGADIKKSYLWRDYSRLRNEFLKALDTQTSTEGSEWIPVGYSADLYQRVKMTFKIASLFDSINMTAPSMYIPTDLVADEAYYISENVNDIGDLIRAKTPTTSRAQLVTKKFGVRVVSSQEMVEDSLFALAPWLTQKVVDAVGRAIENVILNGDDAASNNINGTVGTHIMTYDARMAFDGLRALTNASGKKDFNDTTTTTYTAANIRSLRPLMGIYGINPGDLVHIVGLKLFIRMLGLSEVSTIDKWGPQATFKTGTLAVFDGSSVIVSEFAKEDLNASGVYDGSNTDHCLHMLVNPKGFLRGIRRTIKLAQQEDIDTDQLKTVATVRQAFCSLVGSTYNAVAYGYDIDHTK